MATTQIQRQQPESEQEKSLVSYTVAGNEVKLSYQIVRNFLVRGNGNVTDPDIIQFISVCKFNQLNPFLNEAYLIKYGNTPAQMIVSKEAYFKRADACPEYDGFRAGIIVQRKEDGVIIDREGSFYGEGETLVGGWAEVYRKDRKFPIVARVRLDEYDKKQSVWNEKKSTMICKIAKVQALREAFPVQLGAMYTQEEYTVQDADFLEVRGEVKRSANKIPLRMQGPSDTPASVPDAPAEKDVFDPAFQADANEPGF